MDAATPAWRFIRIDWSDSTTGAAPVAAATIAQELADRFWASQIRCHSSDGNTLVVGQIAQNRYWTRTRARLLALDLIDVELERFGNVREDRR